MLTLKGKNPQSVLAVFRWIKCKILMTIPQEFHNIGTGILETITAAYNDLTTASFQMLLDHNSPHL